MDRYLSQLAIDPGSPLDGRRLRQVDLAQRGILVLGILRGAHQIQPGPETALQAGDALLVHAPREALLDLAEDGLRLAEAEPPLADALLGPLGIKLAEAIITPQSVLADRTLRSLRFRQRFGVSVLAVHRRGHRYPVALADLRLRVGDVVLLEGTQSQLELLQGNRDLWLLGDVVPRTLRRRRGMVALGGLGTAIIVSALGWVPLSVSLLLAALMTVVTRCITMEEVYRMIEWRLIVLIGGMTAFGLALQNSGAAAYLAGWIADWDRTIRSLSDVGGLHPAHHAADPIAVERRRRPRGASRRRGHRAGGGRRPTFLRRDRDAGSVTVVHHAFRAGVLVGLWPGRLQVPRLCSRRAAPDRRLYSRCFCWLHPSCGLSSLDPIAHPRRPRARRDRRCAAGHNWRSTTRWPSRIESPGYKITRSPSTNPSRTSTDAAERAPTVIDRNRARPSSMR